MPIGPFPDFDACVAHMMKPKEEGGGGYDEETAKKVCGKMKAELEESFEWTADIEKFGPLLRGKAIHPIKTYHPNEWPHVRVYLEEEIQKSAETLIGKPLYLDHWYEFPESKVLAAKYNDGALEYIADPGRESERIFDMVRKGDSKHVSIQFDWKTLEKVNGVAPRNINFEHLSLLKDMEPGDPQSTVEIWESIVQQLKEAKSPPPNPQQGSETEKTKMSELKEAEWDQEYVNNLDDNCFAYIEPGGEKDEQGKTTPRSLRHFPYKNAQGNLSPDHVRNGLARLGQELGDWATADAKAQIKKKLCAAAKELEIESEVCDLEEQGLSIEEIKAQLQQKHAQREQLYAQADALWAEIEALEAALEAAIRAQIQAPTIPVEVVAEIGECKTLIKKLREYADYLKVQEQQDDDYQEFISQCMAAGKTMEQCAAEWKEQHPEETVESLKAKVEVLTEQRNQLQEELQRVKEGKTAIIPSTVTPSADILKQIKRLLPERVPMSWGGHYAQLWRNLRNIIKEYESKSPV